MAALNASGDEMLSLALSHLLPLPLDLGLEHHQPEDSNHVLSRPVSRVSQKLLRVPAGQRRGLLAFLALVPEYTDARDYSVTTKYFIVFVVAFAAITGPMGTSIMLPAISDVVSDLNTLASVVNISVGIYLILLGVFPLWWSLFSEKYGRRSIYLVLFTLFLAFSIGLAVCTNMQSLIILRFFAGALALLVQSVGAGSIADLFVKEEIGFALGLYYLGPLLGPFLSPIIGGVVSEAWGWRATQYTMSIFCLVNVVLVVFGLPETLRTADNFAAVREQLRLEQKGAIDEESGSTEHAEAETKEKGPTTIGTEAPNDGVHLLHTATEEQGSEAADKVEEKENEERAQDVKKGPPESLLNETYHTTVLGPETSIPQHPEALLAQDSQSEDLVVDPSVPLSRLSTHSAYSRRLEELSRSASQVLAAPPTGSWSRRARFQLYEYFIRPMHLLVLLTHPPVALIIVHSLVCFAAIYFFNLAITTEYSKPPYGFSSIIVGLLYIPNSVTYIMALIIGGRWLDKLLRDYAAAHNGHVVPELRLLWNLVIAVVLFPPSCLIFGWCLQFHEHWVTPLIGTALFGFASMIVIGTTVTYLVDTLPGKGATGVALNSLVRMILAAIATFVVDPLLGAIGPGILFSIIMGILAVASLALVILKRRGAYYRDNYDLGVLYDKL